MGDRERAFVEGKGTFVEDMLLPETLHLRIVRSPYARARLLRVRGGITHADLNAVVTSVGEGAAEGGSIAYPVLASDAVNFVGQPVAAVLGEDRYRAEDLAVAVDVEYEPLLPVVDPEAALAASPIHPGMTSNLMAREVLGARFDLSDVPVVIEEMLVNARVSPNPLEPRGILVRYDGSRLTAWASTQSAHSFKEGLSRSLGLSPASVRVIAVDTGGAFGSKGGLYPEYVVAAYASMKFRRPVKWIETRLEHLTSTHQGRGARARMKLHADRTGAVRGLEADVLVDAGAYPLGMGLSGPGWIGYQITGPYAIREVFVDAKSVYTNKVPLGPYRGAGRPEAAFFIERMMDFLADELHMDPVDVRLRNASDQPFTSPLDLTVPPFRPFLESAVRELGYRARASAGDVGFSSFVLIPGAGPGESARIAVASGRLKVWLGLHGHGQGHETFVRTLVHEELGVGPGLVDVEGTDTDVLETGGGAWGSRSAMMAGAAVVKAAREIRNEVSNRIGRYTSEGLLQGSHDVTAWHAQEADLNSFGANLVTAEVDDTGTVQVKECAAYYDVGRVLSAAMVESQIVGGSVQGIGQVLTEEAVYGEEGEALTASLADAGLSTAVGMPTFVVRLAHDPSDLPHGAKGVGESPTIGVPPALVRAIEMRVRKRLTQTPLRLEQLARVPPRRSSAPAS
jgi:carbon-monoxide dehydrogenase large subunit